jgi:predicted dehydrogenase
MTETAEQAKRLVDEADRRRLKIFVDHTFIFTGAIKRIRKLIDDGEMGDLYYYDSIRVNLGLFQHDVDVIWDLAVHDISILDYLLGCSPRAVSANGVSHVPGAPENIAFLTLFYDNNFVAHVNVNWLAPVKLRQTLIGGSKKMIVFDDLEPSEKIKIYDKGITLAENEDQIYQMRVGYRIGDMFAPKLDAAEALGAQVAHVVDCIETGRTPMAGGEMGLRVVEILEAATLSMKNHGTPVQLRS